ncbi:MAG: (2Fe-2S) ferredoxin domain-containing protein [Spirochaetales bacterium]
MDELLIEICMGSSCHSRGNYETANLLRTYAEQEPRIKISGMLCEDRCSEGPIVRIDSQTVLNPNPVALRNIITNALAAQERRAAT